MAEHIRGLSYDEVSNRIKQGQVNGDANVKTKTIGEIVRTNLFTFFHAINLVLFVAILIFGTIKNALFMILVVANAVIGIVQEIRAKSLIDKLSLISSPRAIAVRGKADDLGEGEMEEVSIPSSKIVLGDVLKLEAGLQVCADCEVISGSCEVDESLLTGEPDHILKKSGDEIMSGSFVTSGSCYVRVIHVGEDNYASKITKEAGYLKRPNSEIMKSVNEIVKYDGIAILPIGILLFCKQYFLTGVDISSAVTSTVAALIGMIPEGLVLLTSVVLAVSIIRLSRKNALVQELYSIEMLARVDVLCLDKTGTLTEGRLKIHEVVGKDGSDDAWEAAAKVIFGLGDNNPTANATREAICERRGADAASYGETIAADILAKVPFSSARKWSGVKAQDGMCYVLGAAEFVFGTLPEEFADRIDDETRRGRRVLVIARGDGDFGEGDEITLPSNLRCLGIFIFDDVIRESAPETIEYFTSEGVDIKIISGDNPVTVSHVACECKVPGWDNYIDVSKIQTEEELTEAATKYTVFGRVTPEQKLILIKALKAAGHTVAMTGDGVNDVMALKESDCGIAPASGSDAARNVSQIVLMDSNFASMPSIVAEGRRSINNLQRSAALFLSKTIFAAVAAIAFLFIAAPYPLQPIHVSILSGLTIGIPSFVLGLQPNRARVEGGFLRNVITRSLPGGITDAIVVIAASLLAGTFALNTMEVSTVTLMLLMLVGYMVLFKVCWPFDIVRVVLFIAMIAAFILAIIVLPTFFSIAPFTIGMVYEFLTLAVAAILIFTFFLTTRLFS